MLRRVFSLGLILGKTSWSRGHAAFLASLPRLNLNHKVAPHLLPEDEIAWTTVSTKGKSCPTVFDADYPNRRMVGLP